MITSKRQAKSKKQPQIKSSQSRFHAFRLFTVHLFMGLLVIICASSFIVLPKTNTQTAEPSTSSAELNLYPLSILPTETPITPAQLPFETVQSLLPSPTPTATPEMQEDDYCVDVPVILYHHIQPLQLAKQLGHEPLTVDSGIFEQQIKYLKENGYTAISAEDLIYALHNRLPLPEKSVMITIDDGYDDNYTYAFMTAKKYQFVVNFMISTRLINKPGYMNWDHLREMHTNEYAKLYNHTANHAPLGYILKQQIDNELTTSTNDFKNELGLDVKIFTYPYGSYNPIAMQTLKDHGFIAAFTTDSGKTHCLSNIMQLKRVRVGNAPTKSYGF